jgi:hypothetical protein
MEANLEKMLEKEEIHTVNFNQDNGCFIVSTSNGIRVFNTHEFQSTFFRGKYTSQSLSTAPFG